MTTTFSAGEVSSVANSLPLIRRAAVLGAGAMGSRIAAHLANAGIPVLLLDVVRSGSAQGERNLVALKALAALAKAKPAAFYEPGTARLITTGNFEDDLEQLAECDWVIEAVIENLVVKQSLLDRVAPHLRKDAIVTTNTSGLSVAAIGARLPEALRKRWFGTHFFNPPRYMRLVEMIPTAETDRACLAQMTEFVERRLGKSAVRARDTPNFIANRIGIFAMLTAVDLMQRQRLDIEEVDALTGSAIGWPRTGTFRLADMVGLDVLAQVARNYAAARPDQAAALPPFLEAMLARGWLGDKSGQGFYKKAADGGRLALDWQTLEYRAANRPKFPSLEMAKSEGALEGRLPLLISGDMKKDKAAAFLFPLLTGIWNYAADCMPEIADSPEEVDRAMRTGFNWELGPFEMWDAAGVRTTSERLAAAGGHVSPQVKALLQSENYSWYRHEGADDKVFDCASCNYLPVPRRPGVASASSLRRAGKLIRGNSGCSLLDMGEDIALLQLHSEKNAIGGDIVSMITSTLVPESAAIREFRGFVISGDRSDFSVGANLVELLVAAQEGEWDDVDLAVRAFQGMTAAIKFCPRPVVVAPFGMCLGGGAEITLHAAARHPHAELYMGLVESGVGLLPAGGGTKEMALRAIDAAALQPSSARTSAQAAISGELQHAIRQRFETMAMARVSTSAAEARSFGFLSAADHITFSRERLLFDARAFAVALAEASYAAPVPRTVAVPGTAVLAMLKLAIHLMRQGEYISEHDATVATHIARTVCGGAVTPGTLVSEQEFLDLEREAFLSLCGESKTQQRIAYTLQTGKPLRN